MKKFTKVLIGFVFAGIIGVSTISASNISFGHNVTSNVSGGMVGSQCYPSKSAISKAKCQESGKAIQVRVMDAYGRYKSATSSGYNTSYTFTDILTTVGSVMDHTHSYSVWFLP